MTASLYGCMTLLAKVGSETVFSVDSTVHAGVGSPVMTFMVTPEPGMTMRFASDMTAELSVMPWMTVSTRTDGSATPVVERLTSILVVESAI